MSLADSQYEDDDYQHATDDGLFVSSSVRNPEIYATPKPKFFTKGRAIVIALFIILAIAIGFFVALASVETNDNLKVENPNTNSKNHEYSEFRLPNASYVYPTAYDLSFVINNNQNYQCKNQISLTVGKKIQRIIMHGVDLDISHADISGSVSVKKIYFLNSAPLKQQMILFELDGTLNPGNYTMNIDFVGSFEHELFGFYVSDTLTANKMLSTDLEPTEARYVMPCWDEPNFKASFKIDITFPLSDPRIPYFNMPLWFTNNDSTTITYFFNATPPMSTYLFAICISDYEYVATTAPSTSGNILIRTFTPPGATSRGEFALEVANKTIQWYNSFLDIDYPLPKIDLYPVPNFASGAMENWGLVTFRETALMMNQSTATYADRNRVAVVVAHELAHFWWGDLVTGEFWNNLPAHESMASYFEYLAVDATYPEFEIFDGFFAADTLDALAIAGHANVHQWVIPSISNTGELHSIFDSITYAFGASVVRMLHNFIGDTDFSGGCKLYLQDYAYGNAHLSDLFDKIEQFNPTNPVGIWMNSWINNQGYPVLEMVQVGTDQFVFQQSRFLLYPDGIPDTKGYLWWVPISMKINSTITNYNFSTAQSQIFNFNLSSISTFKFNIDQVGFYRVNLPVEWWQKVESFIGNPTSLTPVERAGYVDDALAFGRSQHLNLSTALELANITVFSYPELTSVVWTTYISHMKDIEPLLRGESGYDNFKKYVLASIQPALDLFGWEDTPGLVTKLDSIGINTADKRNETIASVRPMLLSLALQFGDNATLNTGVSKFEDFIANGTFIDPSLRTVIYTAGVAGTAEGYQQVWNLSLVETDAQERTRLYYALADGSWTDEHVNSTLNYCIQGSNGIATQDAVHVLSRIAASPYGYLTAWNFVKSNWAYLDATYGAGGFLFTRLIQSTTEDFTTEEKYQEIQSFFNTNPIPAAEMTLTNSLERISGSIYWKSLSGEAFNTWINSQFP